MYRITHSLLESWRRATDADAAGTTEDFIQTLRRVPKPQTDAMLRGIKFENEITDIVVHGGRVSKGVEDKVILSFARKVAGSTPQVRAEKKVIVRNKPLYLVGVADFVRAGIIYDTKRVSRYEYGKYIDSTQHPMYFELFPEARRFDYLIYDGQYAYTETYRPDECRPIIETIGEFLDYLQDTCLMPTYEQYWEER